MKVNAVGKNIKYWITEMAKLTMKAMEPVNAKNLDICNNVWDLKQK
jgi:hypothetical protein